MASSSTMTKATSSDPETLCLVAIKYINNRRDIMYSKDRAAEDMDRLQLESLRRLYAPVPHWLWRMSCLSQVLDDNDMRVHTCCVRYCNITGGEEFFCNIAGV